MVHRTDADRQRRRDLADASAGVARLMPWATDDGRRVYLATDGEGRLAALADAMEAVQLGIGADLLEHARKLLDSRQVSPTELRFVTARLSEALSDALRVAESRGQRLTTLGEEDPDSEAEVRNQG